MPPRSRRKTRHRVTTFGAYDPDGQLRFRCDLQCDRPCGFPSSRANRACTRNVCVGLPYCWQHSRAVFGVESRVVDARIGRGLFARKPFSPRSLVCPYMAERVSRAELDRRYGEGDVTAPYGVRAGSSTTFYDAACRRGIGALANDAHGRAGLRNNAMLKASNAELRRRWLTSLERRKVLTDEQLAFVRRDMRRRYQTGVWVQTTGARIAPGNEILVSYGAGYWTGRHPLHRTEQRASQPNNFYKV